MTDYIEELMKKAEVSKNTYFRQYNYGQVPYGEEELQISKDLGIECINVRICKDEENAHIYWTELHYPDFTPAKQLELIKLLAERKGYSGIGEQIDHFIEICGLTLEESIAQITSNAIASRLLDKSEIRRILSK